MKKNKMSILLVMCLVFFASCTTEKPEEETVIRPVRYQAVYETGGGRTRSFSGTAKAGVESKLSFKVAGTVKKVDVNVGDTVNKGDVIATLDDQDYLLQLQEAEAGLEQARAQALNAKSNYARVRGLYENRNVSRSDLDSSRAAFQSVNASVRSIEKRLELARSRLSYTKLTAPFSGAISAVVVEENENVNAGMPVVVLTGRSKPEVEVDVPEILISEIKKGDAVFVTFDALRDKRIFGIVSEVGIAPSPYSTTYPVTVTLKNAGTKFRSGMTGEVLFNFQSDTSKERFMVPSFAVSEDQNGRFVFIAIPTEGNLGAVKRIDVKTGELTGKGMEIFEGLSEGDLLITAGVSRIKDGMIVKLMNAKEK